MGRSRRDDSPRILWYLYYTDAHGGSPRLPTSLRVAP
jgi:hypothetical protein